MLSQFIDEDPRVLAIVYGDRDQLHAALLKSPLERRQQPLGGLDPGTARVMSARELDEIRVSERHAEIGKAVGRLLPAEAVATWLGYADHRHGYPRLGSVDSVDTPRESTPKVTYTLSL
jgi:hypothetical protein